jgi:hypothetical protein|nr:MAG TPA: hypothetical protein [Caudoviricetes sp.]
MKYVAETGNVKLYNGDKLIAELHNYFSYEIKPRTITQHDIDIAMRITTHYDFKQDTESGKWYLCADGVRVCEAFPKIEK